MSYKYKDYFKKLHFNESRKIGTDLNESFKMRDELNEVYEQAAKAEEYEAKAKAWDKLNEYVFTTPYDGIDMDTLKNRLNKFMDESGDQQ